jgi:hypothetical protein
VRASAAAALPCFNADFFSQVEREQLICMLCMCVPLCFIAAQRNEPFISRLISFMKRLKKR